MNSRTQNISIGSTLFILMFVAAFAIIRPIYIRVGDALSSLERNLVEKAEDVVGLSFSYQSLSPSILSAINIKGIVVSDKSSGRKLVDVQKVTVSYNFLDFFSANPTYAIRGVTVNGVTVEYDLLKDRELTDKWIALAKNRTKKTLDEHKKIDLAMLKNDLPFAVQLKNVNVHYSDQWHDAVGTIKSLTLRNNYNATGIVLKGSGKAQYSNVYITRNEKRIQMAVNFDLTGTVVPELDGSSATVHFSNAGGADFTVTHLDALVNYADKKFEIRSMRSALPFSVFMTADLTEKTFRLDGDFDYFEPFKLVRVRRAPAYFKFFEGVKISGKGHVTAKKGTGVHYDARFETEWGKRLLGHPFHGSIDVEGDKRKLIAHKLVATGDGVHADFTGDFVYKPKQLSGVLSCNQYALPNGNSLSGEVFIDPLDTGFMMVAPQVFLGDDLALTAVEATVIPDNHSVDFSLAWDDYAHAESEYVGHVRVDGSYLGGMDRYVQARAEVQDVFLDSAALIGAFFVKDKPAETLTGMALGLSPYITSLELYLSSDFKDFSFNAPVCLVANTQKDREMLWFAADGSNQTVQLSRFDLIFGGLSTAATVSADFSNGFDNFTFFGDFTVNAMPYKFSGNYASKWLSIVGDYDFTAAASFGNDVTGSFSIKSLPIPLGKIVPSVSGDVAFSIHSLDEFSFDLYNLEVEEVSGAIALAPRLALSGNINQYGFLIDSIGYSDSLSALSGKGSILWNINNRIFDSIHLSLETNSTTSAEVNTLTADFVNPSQLPFSVDALKNDFYFSAQASVESFPVARFLREQNMDNVLSATATASGTLNNPFVFIDMRTFGMSLYGSSLVAHGSFSLNESGVSAENFGGTWSNFTVTDGNLHFDPDDFSGELQFGLEGYFLREPFSMPVSLSLSSAPPVQKWRLPQNYTATLKVDGLTGKFFPNPISFDLTLLRLPGRYDIISGNSKGLSATMLENGDITARFGSALPVQMEMEGNISRNEIQLDFSDITARITDITSLVSLPFITVYGGDLRGDIRIDGLIADPEFSGSLSIERPEFSVPQISKVRIRTEKFETTIAQNTLVLPQTRCFMDKAIVFADARVDFSRWRLGALDLNLVSTENSYIPVDMKFPLIRYKGDTGLDLNIGLEGKELSLKGMLTAQDADISVVISSMQENLSEGKLFSLFSPKSSSSDSSPPAKDDSSPLVVIADLDLLFGQRVQILFDPILRGAVAPNTPLSLYFDGSRGNFNLKGEAALRGGQIVWLNRNFYMKEGKITFNESQDMFDPRLTVRAETRERDSNGSQVTITLSAINQPVSELNPQFSASPAKSEREIMELLGQVITADSENATSLFLAGGDYLVQSVLIRNIENALRELLKFDIFSVRTNVLQNTVKYGLNNNSTGNQLKFSNFFDNSTVYIGKYFGSSIYADAMMHWVYDESRTDKITSVGGLVFQPEIGLEMSSPFVNIRLGVAPDIEAIRNNMWVSSASLTLSWKFAL